MDNHAFYNDPCFELANILNNLANHLSELDSIEVCKDKMWILDSLGGSLKDTNGNKVGYYEVKGED